MTYEDLLRELGLDTEHLNLLNKIQKRYKKYINKITNFNNTILNNETAAVHYTLKQLCDRVIETGETPNSVINEVTNLQNEEIKYYENYGVTQTLAELIDTVKNIYDIVTTWSMQFYTTLDNLDSEILLEAMQEQNATEPEYKKLVELLQNVIYYYYKYQKAIDEQSDYALIEPLKMSIEELHNFISNYI